jgi:hypothetical protein
MLLSSQISFQIAEAEVFPSTIDLLLAHSVLILLAYFGVC